MQSYFGTMISTAWPRSSNSRLSPNMTSPNPPACATGAHSLATITTNTAVSPLRAQRSHAAVVGVVPRATGSRRVPGGRRHEHHALTGSQLVGERSDRHEIHSELGRHVHQGPAGLDECPQVADLHALVAPEVSVEEQEGLLANCSRAPPHDQNCRVGGGQQQQRALLAENRLVHLESVDRGDELAEVDRGCLPVLRAAADDMQRATEPEFEADRHQTPRGE